MVKPILNEEFQLIINKNEAENQIRREKLRLERQKEREADLENFKLEMKSDLEKLMVGFALPPWT